MKTIQRIVMLAVSCSLITAARGASNVENSTNRFAYGANIGWIDWRGDLGTNGAVVGEFVCSNYLYSANCGWIHLGDGTPTDGIDYSNTGNDYGVNHLGDGRLRGFAYGANIGWINFEDLGNPRIDLKTGNLQGSAYGANVGWISLSNAVALVKIINLAPSPDTDSDTIADNWERQYAGNLTTLSGANHDQDGDGKSDVDEYRADTNPVDGTDMLRITKYSANSIGSTSMVTWTSKPSRCYGIDARTNLTSGAWLDSGLGVVSPDPAATTSRSVTNPPVAIKFFRVRAFKPLSP